MYYIPCRRAYVTHAYAVMVELREGTHARRKDRRRFSYYFGESTVAVILMIVVSSTRRSFPSISNRKKMDTGRERNGCTEERLGREKRRVESSERPELWNRDDSCLVEVDDGSSTIVSVCIGYARRSSRRRSFYAAPLVTPRVPFLNCIRQL